MAMERVILGERQEAGAKHAVNIEIGQAVGGQIGLGPITGRIISAVVEYGGEVVTEVPEGEHFTVAITYEASNPGFVATPADPLWLTTFTAMSTDGTIKGYEHANQNSATESGVDRIEPLGPMPDHDITLRVNIWGNQDYLIYPPCPPEDDWLRTS